MKGRTILIEAADDGGPTRAALLAEGRLEDLLIDPPAGDATPRPGEIYWAKVDRMVPKSTSAFVRLSPTLNGFLRDARGAREGSGLLVQIVSYPEKGKAAPVTARILYKGKWVIHTPDAPGINVSRQIADSAERQRLIALATEIAAALGEPGGEAGASPGLIIRSAADGVPRSELEREIAELLEQRRQAERRAGEAPPLAEPVTGRMRAADLAPREWVGEIVAGHGLFARHGVSDMIEELKSPRVELPSGGWLSIEPTAALVAIDVNTGGDFSPAAGLKANLEAAREIPRQLRLRGLGGQVVVDFAPISKKDRKRVEDAMKSAFRRDPVETSLAGWTTMGLYELQRKRERRPLTELLA